MTRKKQPEAVPAATTPVEEAASAAAPVAPPEYPDLRVLAGIVGKRDRPYVLARLLVEEFARTDGENPEIAWQRHVRSLEIAAASGMRKRTMRRTGIPALAAAIARRVNPR